VDASASGELSATGVPSDTFTLRLSSGFAVVVAGVDCSAIVRQAIDMNLAAAVAVDAFDHPIIKASGCDAQHAGPAARTRDAGPTIMPIVFRGARQGNRA
jgi:hypothetical protein